VDRSEQALAFASRVAPFREEQLAAGVTLHDHGIRARLEPGGQVCLPNPGQSDEHYQHRTARPCVLEALENALGVSLAL
jgi:hypothetical protein